MGSPAGSLGQSLLKSPRQEQREGNFCFCMHAWPHAWGGPGLPKLDQALKRWKGRDPWWYANQNELAAYRYQQLHGALDVQPGPRSIKVLVQRYEGWRSATISPDLKVWGYGAVSPSVQCLGQASRYSVPANGAPGWSSCRRLGT